jgi:uncharacterized protein (DUF952 family)
MILHIAGGAAWQAAQPSGRYLPAGYWQDGFVHCSDPAQVVRVANARFRGAGGLVLLCIDERRLAAPVRYERADDAAEDFPHVYGPIEVAAVIAVLPFTPGPRGFELPELPELPQ